MYLKVLKKQIYYKKIDQDLITAFNKISAAVVLQEYAKVAKNTKREALVAVY